MLFILLVSHRASGHGYYSQWDNERDVDVVIAGTSNDGLVTVDTVGNIRMWETSLSHLEKSLKSWQGMIGDGMDEPLQVAGNTWLTILYKLPLST